MIQKIKYWLNQPFPSKEGLKDTLQTSLIAGLVVFLFLFAFRPFGMHTINDYLWLHCFAFGIITFLVSILFDFISLKVLKIDTTEKSWTFGKWLLASLCIVLLITVANSLYSHFIYDGLLSFQSFIGTLLITSAVSIFPISLLGSIRLFSNLKTYREIAATIPQHQEVQVTLTRVKIPFKDSSKIFEIEAENILYAASMQNYVQLYYQRNGTLHQEVIRNTLTNVQKALEGSSIIRCHRSFLVNRKHIEKISGNAQGLLLSLGSQVEFLVPVSRKYIPLFK